jgi:archaellum component FlaF (FlaF/FlaG flagellin family)
MKHYLHTTLLCLFLMGLQTIEAQNCPAITSSNLVTVSDDGSNNCTYRVDFTMTVNGSSKSVQVVVTCNGTTVLNQCIGVTSAQNGLTLSSNTFSCACNSVKTLVLTGFTSGTCGGASCSTTGNVLPVSFATFTGRQQNGQGCLQWSVGNPASVAQYIIEGSTDGAQFTALQQVAAVAGKESFSVCTPQTTGFYRIKAVEKNGQTYYSSILKLAGENNAAVMEIRTNPVAGTLYFKNPPAAGAQYRIRDITGNILLQGPLQQPSINVQALPAGLYLLDVMDTDGIAHRRFVKQ